MSPAFAFQKALGSFQIDTALDWPPKMLRLNPLGSAILFSSIVAKRITTPDRLPTSYAPSNYCRELRISIQQCGQPSAFGRLLRQLKRSPVRCSGFIPTPQTATQVGALKNAIDQRQPGLGAVAHGHGDRAVEIYDGRWVYRQRREQQVKIRHSSSSLMPSPSRVLGSAATSASVMARSVVRVAKRACFAGDTALRFAFAPWRSMRCRLQQP